MNSPTLETFVDIPVTQDVAEIFAEPIVRLSAIRETTR